MATDNLSQEPAHCVNCGHETFLIPRPEQCPDCGERLPWGSVYAAWPSEDQRKLVRREWAKKNQESPLE